MNTIDKVLTIVSLLTCSAVVAIYLAGCSVYANTIIARPGVPVMTLRPFDAPAGSTATEVAAGKYTVNAGKVTVPAGAVIVVLPSTQPPK